MSVFRRNVETNLKTYRRILSEIRRLPAFVGTEEEIRASYDSLRERAVRGEPEMRLLPDVFALVTEAVSRSLGLRLHEAQILTGICMSYGRIAELPTGEGKTLAAVLTAAHGALTGKGVHVLTFNDYLAKRDAEWMEPVYRMLGLTVRSITEFSEPDERRDAYRADITYVTAKEAGFDYLRGFLCYSPEELVQRPFHMALVDEADSIMIDEARIPLVLAGDDMYHITFDQKIREAVLVLDPSEDFSVDEYGNQISLTESGISRMETFLGIENLYDTKHTEMIAKIQLILQSEFLVRRDVDYLVRDGKILLVDEFTGRTVRNREWPDGLQAAVIQKEGLDPKEYGVVMNRVPLRDFLSFYPRLCGMTGTAAPSADDFFAFYAKTVTVIPPQIPCVRRDNEDFVFKTKEQKNNAVIARVKELHAKGQPVLVGTVSVEDSENLAAQLREAIPAIRVLNAANDREEATVIAEAGRRGAVTISTNMAGRGVDIRLGGKDAKEQGDVISRGGLYVIGTARQESRRIDDQLRGRSGRQGDPGESRFYVSLTDDLMVRYHLSESLPKYFSAADQDGRIENTAVNRAIAHTQRVSEGQNVDAKITLSKYSAILEEQRILIAQKREEILFGERRIDVIQKTQPDLYERLVSQVGEEEFLAAQKRIELYAVNRAWSEHLQTSESLLDEVRMIARVGRDPVGDYTQKMITAFDRLEENICETVLEIFDKLRVVDRKIALEEQKIRGPASTRTYMVNDGTELQNQINEFAVSAQPMAVPLYALCLVADFWKKRHRKSSGLSQDS